MYHFSNNGIRAQCRFPTLSEQMTREKHDQTLRSASRALCEFICATPGFAARAGFATPCGLLASRGAAGGGFVPHGFSHICCIYETMQTQQSSLYERWPIIAGVDQIW